MFRVSSDIEAGGEEGDGRGEGARPHGKLVVPKTWLLGLRILVKLRGADEAGYARTIGISLAKVTAFNTSASNPYLGLPNGNFDLRLAAWEGDTVAMIDNLLYQHFHIVFRLPLLTIRYFINPTIDHGTRGSLIDSLSAALIDRHIPHPTGNFTFSWWIGKTRLFSGLNQEEIKQL